MAVARTNPLPRGMYWIDIFRPTAASSIRDGEPTFLDWTEDNFGKVVVLKREVFPSVTATPTRIWYLFRVTAEPTDFPFRELGFPTITGDPELSSDDVAHKPAPPTPGEVFDEIVDTAADIGKLLVLAALVYLWAKD